MWKNTLAILSFIGACIVAMTIVLIDPKQVLQNNEKDHPPIAKIVELDGLVETQKARSATVEKLTGPQDLHAQEAIETSSMASATLEFRDGLRLKLMDATRVIGDIEAGSANHVNVTVLRGQVHILIDSKDGRTSVYKDGIRLSMASTSQKPPDTVISLPPPSSPLPPEEPSVAETLPEEPANTPTPPPQPPSVLPRKKDVGELRSTPGLSNEEITRVISQQSSRFHRCYVASMNRTGKSKQKGTLWVAFTINPNGKVSGNKVARSPFADQTLNNCLIEVVGRTIFPSFSGQAISVSEFPITAE